MATSSPLRVTTTARLTQGEVEAVTAFLDTAARVGDELNDHLVSDLRHGQEAGFLAALAHRDDALVGYAQASQGHEGRIVGCVAGGDADLARVLLSCLLAELPGDVDVTWWTQLESAPLAAELGMTPSRRLLEMRAPLPLAAARTPPTPVDVRPFRIGHDEAAWLEVNNAAFAWHGEQGGWTLSTLQRREQEPWFDPDGFLLHERDGRLAAFCWTKMHHLPQLVGEIYVIAVHPDFHGTGLGRALTVAGLDHIVASGASQAMLFVDADNTAAVALYEHLGFNTTRIDQSFTRAAATDPNPQGPPT